MGQKTPAQTLGTHDGGKTKEEPGDGALINNSSPTRSPLVCQLPALPQQSCLLMHDSQGPDVFWSQA